MILTSPTYATTVPEFKVPDEVLKMKPEEAYKKAYEEAFKKGFEEGAKSKEDSKKVDNSNLGGTSDILNQVLDCGEFDIMITKIEKDGDLLKLTYDYTNKSKTTSPWMAGIFDAYQDGIELEDKSLDIDGSLFTKNVQKDGTKKNLIRAFQLESDTKKISFEVGDFFKKKVVEFDVELN